MEWLKSVDAIDAFLKLPVYLRTYFAQWQRNAEDAVCAAASGLDLLRAINAGTGSHLCRTYMNACADCIKYAHATSAPRLYCIGVPGPIAPSAVPAPNAANAAEHAAATAAAASPFQPLQPHKPMPQPSTSMPQTQMSIVGMSMIGGAPLQTPNKRVAAEEVMLNRAGNADVVCAF